MKLRYLPLLALAAAATAAQAGTVSYTTATVGPQATNWTSSLSIQQFDPSQFGQLQSVYLELFGGVSGTIQEESHDSEATTVDGTLKSKLTLTRPDNTVLVTTLPEITQSFDATAYDGVTDYAGTSGATFSASGSSSDHVTLSGANDLALFTGTGNVSATLKAQGQSYGDGAGNLAAIFTTNAQGYAKVTYTYADSAVPEPASWAMMLGGFGLMGATLRRRPVNALI